MSKELATLTQAWRSADKALRVKETESNRDSEQRAFDALVDYVEAHDLNYTEHDPRSLSGADQ